MLGDMTQPGSAAAPVTASVVDEVFTLTASAAGGLLPPSLGADNAGFRLAVHAALHQDDDAHDTCTLVACLNPLHPGPCKGWKGNLFKVAPNAYHALEAARVEKANAARIKKIQALKDAGKPIPKKLLQPIVAKPHPHAGKTANVATGEAHAAGKAVSDAAGVHTSVPGKVTLGQAIKTIHATDATSEKGAKGKKPTVASKGIAHVIAQEKVTPQYKLDKASKITPEQWSALSGDEKSIIRGELTKIQTEGFGPQQKKATELLDGFKKIDEAKPAAPDTEAKVNLPEPTKLGDTKPKAAEKYVHTVVHNGETVTRTSIHHYTHASLVQKGPNGPVVVWGFHKSEANALGTPLSASQKESGFKVVGALPVTREPVKKGKVSAPKQNVKTGVEDLIKNGLPKKPEPEAPKSGPSTAAQVDAIAALSNAIPGVKSMPEGASDKLVEAFDKLKSKGDLKEQLPFKKAVTALANAALKVAAEDKAPGFGHGDNDIHIGTLHKEISDHIVSGKTGLPPMVAKIKAHHEALEKVKADHENNPPKVTPAFEPGKPKTLTPEQKKAQDEKLATDAVKAKVAADIAEKAKAAGPPKVVEMTEAKAVAPKPLPAHIQHAIAMANGKALGASWSKNHLAAYQKLSAEEFDTLPPDVQDKIVAELVKGETKFLDPKKKQAALDLLAKFGKAGTPALKTASTPKPDEMSPAQITSHVKGLLGEDAVNPNFDLSLTDTQEAEKLGKQDAKALADGVPQDVLDQPAVAAKYAKLASVLGQVHANQAVQKKVENHVYSKFVKALNKGVDKDGNPLTADDKKIIGKYGVQLGQQTAHLAPAAADLKAKAESAEVEFQHAVEQAHLKAAEPNKLSNYDLAVISDSYSKAWSDKATSAVMYGVKTYSNAQQLKAHADYPGLSEDLSAMKALAGKLAIAHGHETQLELNVPLTDSGMKDIKTPEWKAWQDAIDTRYKLTGEFNALHKSAQAKLDTIRTSIGLKKRAIPKLDAPAVKAAAAEAAFYKTSSYKGPNFGKPSSAKKYLLAKVGDKIAVAHQSAAEKKLATAGTPSAPSPTSKIENVPPVKLGDADASVAHLPDSVKKQITSDFKSMPKGKYLADPAADVFDNLVNLAAAHGKGIDGGISVDQVLKSIDETHSKNLGVANSGMLHKKITEWLATGEGKAYAEGHSTPNSKVVKQLTGELDLPAGVTLAPGQKVQPVAGPGPFDASLHADAFKALTSPQAQAAQDAYMAANGIKWTSAQKHAMTAYTGNGLSAYDGINNWLRGEGPYNNVVKQYAIDIQSAMMPLPQHTLLKRGTGWPPGIASYQSHPGDLVGKTFDDDGFVSSSVAGSGGHFSGKPLQLIIEAPAGTPAAFVDGISHYGGQENEMLLAAGTKFKVLSVEKTTGGHTVMRVRVVGSK